MQTPEFLGSFAASLLAVSLATERAIVVLKTLIPPLRDEGGPTDRFLRVGRSPGLVKLPRGARKVPGVHVNTDTLRRVGVLALSILVAWLTAALLADPASAGYGHRFWSGTVSIGGRSLPVLLVAFLASGGSAFWAQVLGYASAVKDARQTINRSNRKAGAGAVVRQAPPGTDGGGDIGAARAFVEDAYPWVRGTLVPDPVVQTTSAGARIVHFHQEARGIPIYGHALAVLIAPDRQMEISGAPLNASFPERSDPLVPAAAAASAARDDLLSKARLPSLPATTPSVAARFAGPSRPTALAVEGLERPIQAQLCYWVIDGGRARLTWQIHFSGPQLEEDWEVLVEADVEGIPSILYARPTLAHAVSGTVWEFSPGEGTAEAPVPRAKLAFPLGRDSYPGPATGPFPPGAGPWVDQDTTSGNNVASFDANDEELKGVRRDGELVFEPADAEAVDQQVLNAFYVCNLLHDFFLLLGFTEDAGNFQSRNFSGAGRDHDQLEVAVLDTSVEGLADMRSRIDGNPPRLLCLALVAWLSPGRSLKLMQDSRLRARYGLAYRGVGVFMALFPLIAWLLTTLLGRPGKLVFVVEALGLLGFAGFWVLKSYEMKETQAEMKALSGVLAPE